MRERDRAFGAKSTASLSPGGGGGGVVVRDAPVLCSLGDNLYKRYFISLPAHSSANNSSCHQSADPSSAHPWSSGSDIIL